MVYGADLHEVPFIHPPARKADPDRGRLLVFARIAPIVIEPVDLGDLRQHLGFVEILLVPGMTGVPYRNLIFASETSVHNIWKMIRFLSLRRCRLAGLPIEKVLEQRRHWK